MIRRRKWFEMAQAAQSAVAAAGLGAAVLAMLTYPADARGGHGRGFGGHGMHGPQFSGGRRHGNDSYIKAASDERDKLLNARLKSICRGC